MPLGIIMTYINITKFVLINELEKDHSMTETCRLKNLLIFIQTFVSLLTFNGFFQLKWLLRFD